MWQLAMTNERREWMTVGDFDTVTDAARRIRYLEGRTEGGIFLTALFEIDFGDDARALSHLEYSGTRALYAVKRRMN